MRTTKETRCGSSFTPPAEKAPTQTLFIEAIMAPGGSEVFVGGGFHPNQPKQNLTTVCFEALVSGVHGGGGEKRRLILVEAAAPLQEHREGRGRGRGRGGLFEIS